MTSGSEWSIKKKNGHTTVYYSWEGFASHMRSVGMDPEVVQKDYLETGTKFRFTDGGILYSVSRSSR